MIVNKELARLKKMLIAELRELYAKVWDEPSRSGNREFLIKRIIWRMQALEEGDLPERARKKALAMANDADLRVHPPVPGGNGANTTVTKSIEPHDQSLPAPGTILTRKWRNRTILARVLADGGFEYEGDRYRSLSAIARAVTGSHWNGRLFFGISPSRQSKESRN